MYNNNFTLREMWGHYYQPIQNLKYKLIVGNSKNGRI